MKIRANKQLLIMLGKWLVLFGIFWLTCWERLDPDFGWHLQAGNYIRAHGIPAHDLFTYTAPHFPWIDHEWGNDVIVSFLYGVGGYGLLTVLYGLLWSGALVVAAARARLFVLVTAAIAMLQYVGVRPVAWTVLGLAVCLRLVNSRWRWWLIPLFVIWANLHGGFVIGLVAIAFYAIVQRNRQLAMLFVACIVATFLNAYGPRLYVEVARTLFDPTLHSQVNEWATFKIYGASRPFVFLWASGLIITLGRHWRRYIRFSLLLLLSTLSATRNMPLFVIGAVAELDQFFQHVRKQIPHKLDAGRQIFLWTVSFFVISSLVFAGHTELWPLSGNREQSYPTQAIAYLRQHNCEGGNIFNDYNFGGFLIWQLPSQPVYIDGRMPSWRAPDSQKYIDRYYDLLKYPARYPAVFRHYNIRCVLLQRSPTNHKLLTRLAHDRWRTVVKNHYSVLLFR